MQKGKNIIFFMKLYFIGVSSCYHILAFDINRVPDEVRMKALGLPNEKKNIVDTTGCGDNYCAGFLAGMARSIGLSSACISGTAAAALCALGVGSDAGNVDWDLIELFCRSVPYYDPSTDIDKPLIAAASTVDPATAIFSPPHASLSVRLQKMINRVPDSDDEFTPIKISSSVVTPMPVIASTSTSSTVTVPTTSTSTQEQNKMLS